MTDTAKPDKPAEMPFRDDNDICTGCSNDYAHCDCGTPPSLPESIKPDMRFIQGEVRKEVCDAERSETQAEAITQLH